MSQPRTATSPSKGGNGRGNRAAYDLEAVLEIAVTAFNDFGYDATSTAILAERLGTTKAAIYYHVAGKEELLRLALDRALNGLEGVLTEPSATIGSAADRLRYVLRNAVLILVRELPYVNLLVHVRGNTDVEREALKRRRVFDQQITRLVDDARSEGNVRTDVDSGTLTRLLFGMINSIVEWYKPGGTLTPGALADDVIAVAFDGLHDRT